MLDQTNGSFGPSPQDPAMLLLEDGQHRGNGHAARSPAGPGLAARRGRGGAAATPSGDGAATLLGSIGIDAADERVYQALLVKPHSSLSELAQATGATAAAVTAALAQLERKGLAYRTRDGGSRFVLAAPDLAIGALIRRKQEDLDALRHFSEQLAEQFQRAQRRGACRHLVEPIEGIDQVAAWQDQIVRSATAEVLRFDTPPGQVQARDEDDVELERLGAGVRFHVVYDGPALQLDGQLDRLAVRLRAGEEARAIPELPLRMLIADSKLALVPLGADDPPTAALLIRPSVMLDALQDLFNSVWERGVPIPSLECAEAVAERKRVPPRTPTAADRQILALIAAGIKDEAIAYQLDLSPRTLRRRIARLMRALGADNRFQAGYQAARRGWL